MYGSLSSDKWTTASSLFLSRNRFPSRVMTRLVRPHLQSAFTEINSKIFCRLGCACLSSIFSVACIFHSASQQPQLPLSHGSSLIQETGCPFESKSFLCVWRARIPRLWEMLSPWCARTPPEMDQVSFSWTQAGRNPVTTVPRAQLSLSLSLSLFLQRLIFDGLLLPSKNYHFCFESSSSDQCSLWNIDNQKTAPQKSKISRKNPFRTTGSVLTSTGCPALSTTTARNSASSSSSTSGTLGKEAVSSRAFWK